jgi:type II secretory pathway component PulF
VDVYWRMPWRTQGELYLVIAFGVVVVCAVVLLGLFVWQRRKGRDLHERLDHLSTALMLLSDTMEASLSDVLRELSRLGAGLPARASLPPHVAGKSRSVAERRVRSAARRGRSVPDIAAAEGMSEGEIDLMLHMSIDNTTERANHADLR